MSWEPKVIKGEKRDGEEESQSLGIDVEAYRRWLAGEFEESRPFTLEDAALRVTWSMRGGLHGHVIDGGKGGGEE